MRIGYLLLVLFLAVTLNACSSSNKTDGEVPEELPPALDAETDSIPAEEASAPADAVPPPAEEQAAADPVPAQPPVEAAPPPAEPIAAPIAASSPEQGSETFAYNVQSGDTLMKIAFETYGDLYQWKKIYEANKDKINSPNNLPKGLVLNLEKPANTIVVERNGEKYLIKLGDTLGTISDDVYGTTAKWRKLWENNKQMIKNPNRIYAGFYLYYAMTAEERNEADKLKQSHKPAPLAEAVPVAPADAAMRSPAAGGSAPVVKTAQ